MTQYVELSTVSSASIIVVVGRQSGPGSNFLLTVLELHYQRCLASKEPDPNAVTETRAVGDECKTVG
jgi:hypothetical protein